MQFCDAKDCMILDCPRNTKSSNFQPDKFWEDKVCIGEIKDKCKQYKKESKNG
jgi:hypothetical protein